VSKGKVSMIKDNSNSEEEKKDEIDVGELVKFQTQNQTKKVMKPADHGWRQHGRILCYGWNIPIIVADNLEWICGKLCVKEALISTMGQQTYTWYYQTCHSMSFSYLTTKTKKKEI